MKVDAGAGAHARGVRSLLSLVHRLRSDPAELEAMRAASARIATAGSERRSVQEAPR